MDQWINGSIFLPLYYITDRRQFPGPELQRRERLLANIAHAVRAGVHYIQLREKDLSGRELEELAREAVRIVRATGNPKPKTRLLINSRSDVALATGADGVHLPSDDIPASDARALCSSVFAQSVKRGTRNVVVAVSCHTAEEVRLAEAHGADFAVFGPVFEKVGTAQRLGLDGLRCACHRSGSRNTESTPLGRMPVLAVGGITLENARACLDAGAAGIAAIRLFQENDISEVAKQLRQLFANCHP
ncbi:MAG TPA: thiamine phosphate synthase [Terriglobales bacterium]|nr:thiamine phosphate synthase [Terriglobales bacterium]